MPALSAEGETTTQRPVRNKSNSNLYSIHSSHSTSARPKRNKSSNSLSSHSNHSVQFVGTKKKRSDSTPSEGRTGRRKGGFDFGFTALPSTTKSNKDGEMEPDSSDVEVIPSEESEVMGRRSSSSSTHTIRQSHVLETANSSRGRESSRSRSRSKSRDRRRSPRRATPPSVASFDSESSEKKNGPGSDWESATDSPALRDLQKLGASIGSEETRVGELEFPKVTTLQVETNNGEGSGQRNSFGLELGAEGTKRLNGRATFSTGMEETEMEENELVGSFIPDPAPSLLSPAQQYQSLHTVTQPSLALQSRQLNRVPANSPIPPADQKLSHVPFPTSTTVVTTTIPPNPPRNPRKHSNASMLSVRSTRSTNSISFGGLMGPPPLTSNASATSIKRSVPTKIDTTSSAGSFEPSRQEGRRTNSVGSLKALVEEGSALKALEKFKTRRNGSSNSLGASGYLTSLRELTIGSGGSNSVKSGGSSGRGSPLSPNFVRSNPGNSRETVVGYFDQPDLSRGNGIINNREGGIPANQRRLLISKFIEPSHLSLASPIAPNKALPSHITHPTHPSRLRNITPPPEEEEELEMEQGGKGERVASMKKWALGLVKEAERIQAGYESGGKWRDLLGEVLGRVDRG